MNILDMPEPERAPSLSTFEDYTITQVSPLRIKRDGDVNALPFTPDCLVSTAGFTIGTRVRVENAGGRLIVHGSNTPPPFYDWTALTLAGTWVGNYSPAVMRFGDRVSLRGDIYGGTADSLIANLPAWAAPHSRLRVEAYRVLGSGQAPSKALIHVHVEGTAMRCAATSVAGSSPGYSLGHISWSGAAI